MSEVKIDKGIQMPQHGSGRTPKYPWHEMEVGDSFIGNDNALAGVGSKRYPPKLFKSRTVIENGEKVVRIWRVE